MTCTNKSQDTFLILLQSIVLTQPSLPVYARSLNKRNQEILVSPSFFLESVQPFYILRNISEVFKVPQGQLIPQILLFSGQAVFAPSRAIPQAAAILNHWHWLFHLKKKRQNKQIPKTCEADDYQNNRRIRKKVQKRIGQFKCQEIHCFTKIQQFFLNKYISGSDKTLLLSKGL